MHNLASCNFQAKECCSHNHQIVENHSPMALNNLTTNFSQHNSKEMLSFSRLEEIIQRRMAKCLPIFQNFTLKETLYHTLIHYITSVTLFSPMFDRIWTLHVVLFLSEMNFGFQFILVGWLIICRRSVKRK